MTGVIKVNELQGRTTASNITVTDGSTTMQLQQGLAKVWSNLNGTSTIAARDNFNISGYTDNGTGDYTHSYTNNLGNTNYCYLLTSDYQSGTARNANLCIDTSTQSSSSMRIHTYASSNGNADDYEVITMAVFGDLA